MTDPANQLYEARLALLYLNETLAAQLKEYPGFVAHDAKAWYTPSKDGRQDHIRPLLDSRDSLPVRQGLLVFADTGTKRWK